MVQHKFDLQYYKTLSMEDRITYINNCEEKEIHICTEDFSDLSNVWNRYLGNKYNEKFITAHIKKNFGIKYNDHEHNFLLQLCPGMSNNKDNTDLFIEAVELYVQNGWITKENDNELIVNCFTFNSYLPRDNKVCDYLIELYDRLEIKLCDYVVEQHKPKFGINEESQDNKSDFLCYIAEQGSAENFLKFFELYIARNYLIPPNIFELLINEPTSYYFFKSDVCAITKILDMCEQNNIKIYCKGLLKQFCLHCSNWNMILRIIDICEKNSENVFCTTFPSPIVGIGKNFGLDENLYVCKKLLESGVTISNVAVDRSYYSMSNNFTYFDAILKYNTFEVVISVLGFIKKQNCVPTNNFIKIRVPCYECLNGEPSSCNYRNVTSNYICMVRFGCSLSELLNYGHSDMPPTNNEFSVSYTEFCGPADALQVFNAPGKNILPNPEDSMTEEEYEIYTSSPNYQWPYKKYEINPEIMSIHDFD